MGHGQMTSRLKIARFIMILFNVIFFVSNIKHTYTHKDFLSYLVDWCDFNRRRFWSFNYSSIRIFYWIDANYSQ